MNTGTKIRTALRIAVSLNTAIYAVTAAVGNLGWGWLTITWAVVTILSDFAVSALTTYYNQDFTVEGDTGTKITREMKANRDTATPYVEEPEDSEVPDVEVEVVENDN